MIKLIIPLLIVSIFSFYLGVQFENKKTLSQSITNVEEKSIPEKDNNYTLLSRCGDWTESQLGIQLGHFEVFDGPQWAPDCRHIAWSYWQTGTGIINPDDPEGKNEPLVTISHAAKHGLYLYDDHTKKSQKVLSPKNTVLVFKDWQDSKTIIFEEDQKKYVYNIETKEIQSTE